MLLLDNSAWARIDNQKLPPARSEEIARWMESGELVVCIPFLLEAGYSARSGAHYETLMRDLQSLPTIRIDAGIERAALRAQATLARTGHHRLPPADLVIATCAHHARAGVLHYDGDYDIIAQRTELEFESEWVAPPGSL